MNFKILFLLYLVVFIGCGGAGNSKSRKTENIKVDSDEYLIKNLDNVDNMNININTNNKELYLLLINTSNNRNYIKINKSIIKKNKDEKIRIEKSIPIKQKFDFGHTPQYITDFNHKSINNKRDLSEKKRENISYNKDYVGEYRLFYLERDMSISTKATARKIVRNIKTEYGNKTVNIWVSDDSFGDDCFKLYCVKQNMVEALADSFLKDGNDNDIYDWVTNILGEEWGEVNSNSLIDNRGEITILLTDIDNDNRVSGGMQGYFYAKDNYKKEIYSGSNERVMLYIDSVMFASHYNGEWSMENSMTKKIVSTLAHEFAHMVHFYQKNVCLNTKGLKPWIDEMVAVGIEDIIANKLKTTGVRGVSYTRGDAGDDYNQHGRFPLFNENINKTLPIWSNKREDYAMVSAFGSYLIRNYGGAELLHNILHNKYTDEEAIVYAVNKSSNGINKDFDTLMRDWGVAVLLSSETTIDVDSGYLYNLGDFIETEYKNSSYSLGSINFFKYYHRPHIVDTVNYIEPKSNLYYKISKDIIGEINIQVDKSSDIKMTLVVK